MLHNQMVVFELLGRNCLEITTEQLAEWLGCSTSTVNKYKKEERKVPDSDRLMDVFCKNLPETSRWTQKEIVEKICDHLKKDGHITPDIERCRSLPYESFIKRLIDFDLNGDYYDSLNSEPAVSGLPSPPAVDIAAPVLSPVLSDSYPRLSISFLGRDVLLKELHERMTERGFIVLYGIGGIGKSCAALRYIETYKAKYRQIQHVYFDQSIERTVLKLSFQNLREEGKSASEKFELRIRQLSQYGADTLLVIDNMDIPQEALDSADYAALRRCRMHILITSRHGNFAETKDLLPVDALSLEEQMALFETHYKSKVMEQDRSAVLNIFRQVQGHTLLIELIAKTMGNSDMTAREMLPFLKDSQNREISDIVTVTKDESRSQTTILHYVSGLFDISSLEENERCTLMFMSLVPLNGILRPLFKKLAGYDNNNLMNLLAGKSWMIEDKSEDGPRQVRLRLHPVIKMVVLLRTKPDFEKCETFLNQLEEQLQSCSDEEPEVINDLCGLARSAIDYIRYDTRKQIGCLERTAALVSQHFQYTFALEMYDKALASCSALKTDEPKAYQAVSVQLHIRIAELCTRLADYPKSIGHYKEALALETDIENGSQATIAALYNKIAFVYRKASEYPPAITYYQKAEESLKTLTDLEAVLELATTYNDMGIVYINQNDDENAMKYYKMGLEIRIQNLSDKDSDLAYSYHNIGTAYQRLGKYPEAIEHHIKALEIREKIYPRTHPNIAASYTMIGNDYVERGQEGDFEKAWKCFQTALSIRLERLGERHPDVAWTYSSIGDWYLKQRVADQALEQYLHALSIRRDSIGADHAYTADALYRAGLACEMAGDGPKAAAYLTEAQSIQQKKGLEKALEETNQVLSRISASLSMR